MCYIFEYNFSFVIYLVFQKYMYGTVPYTGTICNDYKKYLAYISFFYYSFAGPNFFENIITIERIFSVDWNIRNDI